MSIERNEKGRFVAGGPSANPNGRPTIEQRVAKLVQAETPELLVRAFERAKTDDAVMAALLNFMAAALGEKNVDQLQHQISALAVGGQPQH